VQSAIAGLAGAGSPIVTGMLYDRTHDYRLAICVSTAAFLFAFVLALLLHLRSSQRIDYPGVAV